MTETVLIKFRLPGQGVFDTPLADTSAEAVAGFLADAIEHGVSLSDREAFCCPRIVKCELENIDGQPHYFIDFAVTRQEMDFLTAAGQRAGFVDLQYYAVGKCVMDYISECVRDKHGRKRVRSLSKRESAENLRYH